MTTTTSSIGSFFFNGFTTVPFDLYAYADGYYPGKLQGLNFEAKGIKIVLTPLGKVTPTSQWVDYYCDQNTYLQAPLPVGSVVEFPNHDPFFHNVFSLFEGKRFDLGLYEAGSSRGVHFDRIGVSYIFCNIHPEMSAVVITLATPLYAISNAAGRLSVPDVPFGRYTLHTWSEHGSPESSEIPSREITISEDSPSLGVIKVPAPNSQTIAHKNKYGRDYDEPTPENPVYRQQR